MKLNFGRTALAAIGASAFLSTMSNASQAGMDVHERAAAPLNRVELHRLEEIADRVESMMSGSRSVATRVWPHAVRDAKGRLGIFIGSSQPLFDDQDAQVAQYREAWVVFGLVAAVKYCEGSQVGHIGFTDLRGMFAEQWYYDLDMATAREVHRLLTHGFIQPAVAFRMISSAWQKVTVNHQLAVR